MDTSILKSLIGETVQIYPGDTYTKYGIIQEVDDTGILVLITFAQRGSGYTVGNTRFISHSSRLTLELVEDED